MHGGIVSRLSCLRAAWAVPVGLTFANGFFLLFAIWLLRPVRETFMLADGSVEMRSYAVAAVALASMAALPCYCGLYRRYGKTVVRLGTMLFSLSTLFAFYIADLAGWRSGFAFFTWLGVFGVMTVAQFWVLVTDLQCVKGRRRLPHIAAGASLGAWTGSYFAAEAIGVIGHRGLMLTALAALLASTLLASSIGRREPAGPPAADASDESPQPRQRSLGGFGTVLRDRYLCLIAFSVVLLTCINSIGDFVLAVTIDQRADALIAAGAGDHVEKGEIVGELYGEFYAWVNLIALLTQTLLVALFFRTLGAGRAALILPVAMVFGYGLLAFLPIFAVLQSLKVFENGWTHSLQSTARHAFFVPLGDAARHEGKTVIDTFFCRLGDLTQAGIVYAGSAWFGFELRHFLMLNTLLAVTLALVFVSLARRFERAAKSADATA